MLFCAAFNVYSDNTPYEKIGNAVRSLADEIPFDIPDSWEWVRFKNLVDYGIGKTPPRKEPEYWDKATHPWVSIADMVADGVVEHTKECVNDYAAERTFKKRISKAGTLLMSFKLTVGKVSILGIDAFHNEAIISIYPFLDPDQVVTRYLFAILPLMSQAGDTKTAIKGNTLNSDSLDALLIPLPPINEQRRICDKLNEVAPVLQQYNSVETTATQLNETFPESLKKSILQMASQGKLVPQDPSDEPAEVLLERIREEKARLVKEGKIKKDKHESVIFRRDNSHYEKLGSEERCIDDEIPFVIPDSWKWVRFESIIVLQSGQDFARSEYNNDGKGIPYITGASNIIDEKIAINRWTDVPKCFARKGELLLVCKGAGVGKMAVLCSDKVHIARQIMGISPINCNIDYLRLVLSYNINAIRKNMQGVIPGISRDNVLSLLFPLPPLEEQRRIVDRVGKIMPLLKGV